VDSTSLALSLDPEDLRGVYRAYQRACAQAINRYGGRIVRFAGDGVLCAFGHPEAHEDDPERVVRAAHDLMQALRRLPQSAPQLRGRAPSVRIGVATGLAVVGDNISIDGATEWTVIGPPSHTAARLQSLAEPGQVLVDEVSHDRLRGRFEATDLGPQALKGFDRPQRVYSVEAEAAGMTPSDLRAAPVQAPFVGRAAELAVLLEAWRATRSGEGRVVMISGEPGVGKSRLLRELLSRIAPDGPRVVPLVCSPHHANSAFHPVQRHVGRVCGISETDDEDTRRRALAESIAAFEDADEEMVVSLDYLMLGAAGSMPGAGLQAGQLKARALRGLTRVVCALSRRAPVFVMLEDMHWNDPSSMELLDAAVHASATHAILIVMSWRSGELPAEWDAYRRAWLRSEHACELVLDKLDEDEAAALVESLRPAASLDEELLRSVLARGDGNPLFLEEMVTHYAESDERPSGVEDAPAPVPSTLAMTLLARLDRLGDAKQLVDLACVIGREFRRDLLHALSGLSPEVFESRLDALLRTGLFKRSAAAGGRYEFKHRLLRDAAYDSLAHSRRRTLHATVASTLRERFAGLAGRQPEIPAHHHALAEEHAQAAALWHRAGMRALERSANVEAARHLHNALASLARLPRSPERQAEEADILLELGPALITTRGAASAQAAEVYERALAICEELPASQRHFAAQWGWWRVSMNHDTGRERGDRLLGLARRLGDPGLQMQAHHSLWATTYMLGDQPACCEHIREGLALYDPQAHRGHADVYGGHDARVCAHGELAVSSWLQGDTGAARAAIDGALAWARELDHLPSLAHACDYELMLLYFMGNTQALLARCEALIELSRDKGFADYAAKGRLFRGWARMREGDAAPGIAEMEDAFRWLRENSTHEDFPVFLDMLAEGCQRSGRYEQGLRHVDVAFAESATSGMRFWDSALHRRRGELFAAAGERLAMSGCFAQAMETGTRQRARWLELRAVAAVVRNAPDGDRPAPVRGELAALLAANRELRELPELACLGGGLCGRGGAAIRAASGTSPGPTAPSRRSTRWAPSTRTAGGWASRALRTSPASTASACPWSRCTGPTRDRSRCPRARASTSSARRSPGSWRRWSATTPSTCTGRCCSAASTSSTASRGCGTRPACRFPAARCSTRRAASTGSRPRGW